MTTEQELENRIGFCRNLRKETKEQLCKMLDLEKELEKKGVVAHLSSKSLVLKIGLNLNGGCEKSLQLSNKGFIFFDKFDSLFVFDNFEVNSDSSNIYLITDAGRFDL